MLLKPRAPGTEAVVTALVAIPRTARNAAAPRISARAAGRRASRRRPCTCRGARAADGTGPRDALWPHGRRSKDRFHLLTTQELSRERARVVGFRRKFWIITPSTVFDEKGSIVLPSSSTYRYVHSTDPGATRGESAPTHSFRMLSSSAAAAASRAASSSALAAARGPPRVSARPAVSRQRSRVPSYRRRRVAARR